ncbi:hypothetical protein MP228_010588 [Amoeboaphelidium protococcarum]|nr:hypothetical protein MP228_010588 [Amoeboaphelidium protococcarum]
MDYDSELKAVEQEIKALENSQEYKTLAKKNSVYFVKNATDDEKADWELLREMLAELKDRRRDYVQIILSQNAHTVKKADTRRKGYKVDVAVKDERLLLSDVAIKMWERFQFDCVYARKPSFGDLKKAAGFRDEDDVRDYFNNRANGQVEKDEIKECLSEQEWVFLISLNSDVNRRLHDKLIVEGGSLRVVLEHKHYNEAASLVENLVLRLYQGEKVDVKDALSDSSG